jgi:hypothetical protein
MNEEIRLTKKEFDELIKYKTNFKREIENRIEFYVVVVLFAYIISIILALFFGGILGRIFFPGG